MDKPNQDFVELAARSTGQTETAFNALLPAMGAMISAASTPEQALGIVQALYRCATVLATSLAGTPLDVLMRNGDDAAALARAHWNAASHFQKILIKTLEVNGIKVVPELKRSSDACQAEDDPQEASKISSNIDPKKAAQAIVDQAQQMPSEEPQASLQDIASLINSKGGQS